MGAPRDQFDPSRLPDPEAYFSQTEGLTLKGRGDWRTTLCVFHEDGKPSLALNVVTGGFVCYACGTKGTDVVGFYMERHGVDFKTAARALGAWIEQDGEAAPAAAPPPAPLASRARAPAASQPERLSDYGSQVWSETLAIAGEWRAVVNVAGEYLQARHCVIPPADSDLRWHPRLKHGPSGYEGPALVALVTHAVTREPLTLHRTWIQADGTKAPVEPARMLLGGHRKAGGVIRLWPDEAVTQGLGIAEGIETALTLARVFQPVWACIDAGNLGQLPTLPGIEALTIAADHDDAGLKASQACAQRWADAGTAVRLVVAPAAGADLNDFARAAA